MMQHKVAASAGKVQALVDRSQSLKVVFVEMGNLRHTTHFISKGLDLCEKGDVR